MSVKKSIVQFIKAGANHQEGLRLFALVFGQDHPFLSLASKGSRSAHAILVSTLARKFNIPIQPVGKPAIKPQKSAPPRATVAAGLPKLAPAPRRKLREDYPFLASPDCPQELKALVADKITAYHNYTSSHATLFDCTTDQQQLDVVSLLVESFIENRAIHLELQYYKKHRTVLGRHKVFREFKELRQLRQLGPVALVEKRDNLQHNIWRIQSQLKKNDKPHLRPEREKRLQQKQRLLDEVTRLLATAK